MNTMVKARYSHPSSPMQLTYHEEGMLTEFILMTIGDYRGASATPSVAASRAASKRPASKQPLEATSSSKRVNASDMPPPPVHRASTVSREALSRKDSRPSPPPPQPSVHSQALFYPEEDPDKRWDPVNYDEDQDEMLLWDKDGNDVSLIHVVGSHILTESRHQSLSILVIIPQTVLPRPNIPSDKERSRILGSKIQRVSLFPLNGFRPHRESPR